MIYKWQHDLQEEARTKSTLYYMNLTDTKLGRLHQVWDTAKTDPLTNYQVDVRVRLLVHPEVPTVYQPHCR